MSWFNEAVPEVDYQAMKDATDRCNQLTKPPGSLGQLERIVIQLAGLQSTATPSTSNRHITIFAADHGVAEEGVSAFPQAVTKIMLANFAGGGAAINVLANQNACSFEVINLGLAGQAANPVAAVTNKVIGNGTHNFCQQSAMNEQQLLQAMAVGRDAVLSISDDTDIFIGGEMGIANTTSAAALSCALLNKSPADIVGYGTGVDESGLKLKVSVVERALALHQLSLENPIAMLQALGGFEIAALVGAYITCAQQKLPVVVDGFICTVSALLAERINPGVRDWMLFSHKSAEKGHSYLLKALQAEPILSLDMRLGEGSGAAMALPIIDLACKLQQDMATFAEAGIVQS